MKGIEKALSDLLPESYFVHSREITEYDMGPCETLRAINTDVQAIKAFAAGYNLKSMLDYLVVEATNEELEQRLILVPKFK